MSTLLKTAAMGLLSRTLQTLLNKYLLEVDVEGVAMPSLIDVDGHSGWGVRLCNVRLREGVELMTLPGKRKVKKTRPKRRTAETHSVKGTSKSDDPAKRQGNTNATRDDDNTPRKYYDREQNSGNHSSIDENGVDSELVKLMSDNDHVITPTRSSMMSEDTGMESALSSRVPSPTFVCRTSVASAVSGCLLRANNNDATTDEESDMETPSSPLSRGALPLRGSLVDNNVVFDTKSLEVGHEVKPKEFGKLQESESMAPEKVTVETVCDHEMQNDKKGEDEEEEEEFYMVEEDMVLCLGKAGRIGTLDIRLVGKELHVMVEDAFLTVEACPKHDESDDNSTRPVSTSDTTKDDGTKAKKKDAKKTSKQSSSTTDATSGERLVEGSALARAISAIPHLLLRDVRVQLIVRSKAPNSEGEMQTEVSPDDSVVELSIEMLSVASGEDFLENFNNDSESKMAATDLEDSVTSYSARQRVSLQVLEERDENEYLFKRLRTGKGPEGGISIKIYPPKKTKKIASRAAVQSDWAVQSYANQAQFCLFRCSGLDIRTRIFLGKQKEVALRNNDYAWYGDEYDEYTMDSMLYGVDYIAPVPSTLPPLKKNDSFNGDKKVKAEVERFTTDENGIQSNKVRSCFHKAARGLAPILCQKDHLPSENCPYCWEDTARPNSYSEHPLDSRTPLPGIVFSVEISEPVELNVDRSSLEVIGNIQSLFVQKSEETTLTDSNAVNAPSKSATSSITQTLKNMAFRTKGKKETLRAAFPSYMKPETIEILGLCVSMIILRVHVMKNSDMYDLGLSFRYWEATLRCITADVQMHRSKERYFQDIRFDIGYLATNDYFGVNRKRLLAVGVPLLEADESDSVSVRSHLTGRKAKEYSCWPNTAAVLLQVQVMADVAAFESRESHALQLRLFSLGESDSVALNATLNARVGILNVDLPSTLPIEMDIMIKQAIMSLFGSLDVANQAQTETPNLEGDSQRATTIPALMKFGLRLDGGHFMWSPLVDVKLPMLKVGGELSSDYEVFLETILNHVKVQYGNRSIIGAPQSQLSLVRMAHLPEDVRMRILFFLKDLGPLEKALGIPREKNSFLRCRAVNKGIVKVAKRSLAKAPKRKKSNRMASDSRPSREDILAELTKLDEHALLDVWTAHRNRRLRLARPRSNSDK